MLCQECGKKPSTLHFTKIVNGEKTEFHICESCARERGEGIPGTANGFSIHSLLSGLLDFEPGSGVNSFGAKPQQLRCEKCGLTYTQFSKMGRFGCSNCYTQFGSKLDPILKRVHGNSMHIGKIPKRTGGQIQLKREIEELRRELQNRIEHEEFENAAQIRDRIRELEQKVADA
ncbi:UvrB/UvrC motif-containing protein [Paenibacillus sp. sptzw28]|jgi:protein arginine kinase activator|uniref:UvrB/UvrC motif-containing protein n=1 Tax=Paenibacillus sp. sptzw28 TaxID=715179 RepID=UPI001C6E9C42|nr:UvrB/UvrC motif-containing protein [Paenibacillus sp. sptzw28]QYR22147.1 UvrB/UvrC motif-containing protein [Paenibacillus sp. sptzw28]